MPYGNKPSQTSGYRRRAYSMGYFKNLKLSLSEIPEKSGSSCCDCCKNCIHESDMDSTTLKEDLEADRMPYNKNGVVNRAFDSESTDKTGTEHATPKEGTEKRNRDKGSFSSLWSSFKQSTSRGPRVENRRISIHRKAITQEEFIKRLNEEPIDGNQPNVPKSRKRLSCSCNEGPMEILTRRLPIINWMRNYQKSWLIDDLIAGITVSIMHIPQGLAYGSLASVQPINGLYVSTFPALIYCLLGTSRHISIGTFAVISLLVNAAIADVLLGYGAESTNTASKNDTLSISIPSNLEIAETLALIVGILQFLMGLLHMGALSILMSEPMISGFTTGAATHVVVSQLRALFGLQGPRRNGLFKSLLTVYDVFAHIGESNAATMIISAITLFICAFVHELNGRYKDRLRIPIPIDLIIMVVVTAISYFMHFHANFGVPIVGLVPKQLPVPRVPRMDLIPPLTKHAIVIAIVTFTIGLSMAKLFAKQHKYAVDANQELIAIGSANVFTSFLQCYPCAVSLSRSSIQSKAGGKTQLASVISSVILLAVMMSLGPLFRTLPRCILSVCIIVALKGLFCQVTDFFRAWHISKLDACAWVITYLAVVILDIDIGIIAGVSFSIITVVLRSVMPSISFVGQVPGTDIYLDVDKYAKARELSGVKIYRFCSSIHFANREVFKAGLFKPLKMRTGITSDDEQLRRVPETDLQPQGGQTIFYVIFDMSSCNYIDMSAVETIKEIIKELTDNGITVYFAACTVRVYGTLHNAGLNRDSNNKCRVFPAVHDAVLYAVPPTQKHAPLNGSKPCNPLDSPVTPLPPEVDDPGAMTVIVRGEEMKL